MSNEPVVPFPEIRVLVIETDAIAAEATRRFLEAAGMLTAWAPTAAEGMDLARSFRPEVVLLGTDLPDADAVSLIGRLARDCCIIVISERSDEAERVAGLEAGADDYLAKPASLREMVARIRAVHRRLRPRAPAPGVQRVGEHRVDLQRRAVYDAEGQPVVLTGAEFTALQTLLEAAGKPVTRERLSEAALRHPWRPEDRSIDQLIFNLRRKLADGDRALRLIQSVRGAGYVLVRDSGES